MTKKVSLIESDAMAVLQERQALEAQDMESESVSAVTVNGWTQIDLVDLPTKGKFYKEVWVKPLDVKTVREISVIEANNTQATLRGMCSILDNHCYIIDMKGNRLKGAKLKRADAISVMLIIRAITYNDDINIELPTPIKCPNSGCGKDITKIQSDGAAILEWPSKLDEISVITPEGSILYGGFTFHLPSVEEVAAFVDLIVSQDPDMQLDATTRGDASALLYICEPKTNPIELRKEITRQSSAMYGRSIKDIAVFRKFVQFIDKSIGMEPMIDIECPHCQHVFKAPFSVGLSEICLPVVEDF